MKSEALFTNQLEPGMTIAEDVYTLNNQMILAHGISLTDRMIARLNFYSVRVVYVYREKEGYSKVCQWDTGHTGYLLEVPEFKSFQKAFMESVEQYKAVTESILNKSDPLNMEQMLQIVDRIVDVGNRDGRILDMIHVMRRQADVTYVHSLNVAIISKLLGLWLKLPARDVDMLAVCGLLHDIGKLKIPDQVLNKQGSLLKEDMMMLKAHTSLGQEVLLNKNADVHITNVAYQHHERADGTGYFGMTKGEIPGYVQIVSIADMYDAMAANRVYRPPICPFKIIDVMIKDGQSQFDKQYISTFVEHVSQAYLNSRITLSNGLIGEIVMLNAQNPTKPVVRTQYGYIDLSQVKELEIEDLL